ncbi:uncharacterized protein PAC_05627 [Phialocephala subalpina]|uniref:Uncharacterized protein n=1 Tax=Phialocephala subalpina TaxID=576137 RepID=A0A1L7WSJ5_9HELO|nr:uncharacterized protein PAC_05627 [Phialocephala subalpina]
MAHKGSSTKAHNGSTKPVKSSSHPSKSHKHTDKASKASSSQERVDRFIKDDRDYKSHAVTEYDPYQDEARRQHEEQLKDVIEKRY